MSALSIVLGALTTGFPLPVAIVQHLDPRHVSMMPEILGRRTRLVVKAATHDDVLKAGVVYVATPDRHMEIAADDRCRRVRLADSKPVHFVRPSADRLFESAAEACGAIIGVVLTGTGTDGASGALAIKHAGGVVIAQNEASSAFFAMPHAAIATGAVDLILPLEEIGPMLLTMTRAMRP